MGQQSSTSAGEERVISDSTKRRKTSRHGGKSMVTKSTNIMDDSPGVRKSNVLPLSYVNDVVRAFERNECRPLDRAMWIFITHTTQSGRVLCNQKRIVRWIMDYIGRDGPYFECDVYAIVRCHNSYLRMKRMFRKDGKYPPTESPPPKHHVDFYTDKMLALRTYGDLMKRNMCMSMIPEWQYRVYGLSVCVRRPRKKKSHVDVVFSSIREPDPASMISVPGSIVNLDKETSIYPHSLRGFVTPERALARALSTFDETRQLMKSPYKKLCE